MYIGEPHIATADAEGPLLMVYARLGEDGRGDAVDVHEVLDGGHSHIVGRTVGYATPDAAARQPDCAAADVMVAACKVGEGTRKFL